MDKLSDLEKIMLYRDEVKHEFNLLGWDQLFLSPARLSPWAFCMFWIAAVGWSV